MMTLALRRFSWGRSWAALKRIERKQVFGEDLQHTQEFFGKQNSREKGRTGREEDLGAGIEEESFSWDQFDFKRGFFLS